MRLMNCIFTGKQTTYILTDIFIIFNNQQTFLCLSILPFISRNLPGHFRFQTAILLFCLFPQTIHPLAGILQKMFFPLRDIQHKRTPLSQRTFQRDQPMMQIHCIFHNMQSDSHLCRNLRSILTGYERFKNMLLQVLRDSHSRVRHGYLAIPAAIFHHIRSRKQNAAIRRRCVLESIGEKILHSRGNLALVHPELQSFFRQIHLEMQASDFRHLPERL